MDVNILYILWYNLVRNPPPPQPSGSIITYTIILTPYDLFEYYI